MRQVKISFFIIFASLFFFSSCFMFPLVKLQNQRSQNSTVTRSFACTSNSGTYTKSSYQPEEFERAKKLIKKYGEGGGFTVFSQIERAKKYCGREGDYLMTWLALGAHGHKTSLATAVHETTHHFTSTAGVDLNGKYLEKRGNTVYFEGPAGFYSSFYLEGLGVRHIKHYTVFDSIKITELIPKSKFANLRYDTYILGDKYMASRQFGIYGLLDEYHAYYSGNKISYGMTKDGLIDDNSNEFTSFAEFTLFILKYLQYAKSRHPALYKTYMAQKDLMETFIGVHDKFEPLFCYFAKRHMKWSQNISNYKKTGEYTYAGRACTLKMTSYQTSGTKVFYSFSKDIENYAIELQNPVVVQIMKEARQAAQ